MKALVIHAARDLHVEERETATPGPGEVSVVIGRGGICGSDLHYCQHGGFGAVRIREPMILGHEVAGTISEISPEVADLAVGDRVAVSPSRPCRSCKFCDEGNFNHCLNMRFYGSAMPMPHIQGAFREQLGVDASQCHKLADGVSLEQGAFAEPFAVTLHAMKQAGDISGKRILITGCGPIGALCILAAKAKGAGEIIVTDVAENALEMALRLRADKAINVAADSKALDAFGADKGTIDIMIEASGNQAAIAAGLAVLRPKGTLVQLGLGGDVTVPLNMIVAKEIEMRGSFRFHEEFAEAVDLINHGVVDVMPLLTDTFPLDDAVAAFELAGDRSKAMKVQLAFA